jgi:hypothetical protein
VANNIFHGELFKNNKLKKKKKIALRLCVSLSWFKEIGGLHAVNCGLARELDATRSSKKSRAPHLPHIVVISPKVW